MAGEILILADGFIGNECKKAWGDQAVLDGRKIKTVEDVIDLLEEYKPDAFLSTAGVRGKPDVEWCSRPENKEYTHFGNAVLPFILAKGCKIWSSGRAEELNLGHVGSGCVFYDDSPDPRGWKEDDTPNPKSHYSVTKAEGDEVVKTYPNVGIYRIRIPIDDSPSEGNILDKLFKYRRVFDVANSLTVVSDMVDAFYQLLGKRGRGIFHVTNPGALHYRTIVEWFKEVDPTMEKELITPEEAMASGIIKVDRSTNRMYSSRMQELGISMPPIEIAARKAFEGWAEYKRAELATSSK